MKIKRGEDRVRLPKDYSQILGVSVLVDMADGSARWYMVAQVYRETIERERIKTPELLGIPTLFSFDHSNMLIVWPKPDRDMEIRIRYTPPEEEM